ncbi:MAG: hypothetical protein LAN36_13105 [Acidobacteriia bacterium]|nr:hypothetical protein [Terriglobia bacterium]
MEERGSSNWMFLTALTVLIVIDAFGFWVALSRGVQRSELAGLLWSFAIRTIAVVWLRANRRALKFSVPYEFDAFAFAAWPLVVPYYLYRTRGGRGLLLAAKIGGLIAVPYLVAALAYALLAKR